MFRHDSRGVRPFVQRVVALCAEAQPCVGMIMSRYAGLLLGLLLVACADSGQQAEAPYDPERPWRQPGDVIDSVFPMDVMLARFREPLPKVEQLKGSAGDRETLVRTFIDAVAAGDSTTLTGLLVSRAEYAWLIYPEHLYAKPPYELDPGIHWLQVQASSSKGLARILERYGKRPLEFRSLACNVDTLQFTGGVTKAWAPCTVTYRGNDSMLTRRLFGTIVERDGVAKFLGYANEF